MLACGTGVLRDIPSINRFRRRKRLRKHSIKKKNKHKTRTLVKLHLPRRSDTQRSTRDLKALPKIWRCSDANSNQPIKMANKGETTAEFIISLIKYPIFISHHISYAIKNINSNQKKLHVSTTFNNQNRLKPNLNHGLT